MQENGKSDSKSLLRKILIIIFLPIIIIIWMTGWTLTQIIDQEDHMKNKQKTLQIRHEFKAQEEPEEIDKESRIANEPILA